MGEKEILNRLKYLITKKRSLEEICQDLKLDESEVYKYTLALKNQNARFDIIDGRPVKKKHNYINLSYEDPYRIVSDNDSEICLISDIHYGSSDHDIRAIESVYENCDKRGIKTILCAGDFTDGYNEKLGIRPSPSMLIDYIVKNHPHLDGIKFYTIGGNHDEAFIKNDGIDIIDEIAKKRDDIIYLGRDASDVMLNDIKIKMVHDAKKISKNSPAKNTNSLYNVTKVLYDSLKIKPDILQLGHIHSHFYTVVGNTHIFQTGALVSFPSYELKNAEMSYWFANFRYDDNGNLVKIIPELEQISKKR